MADNPFFDEIKAAWEEEGLFARNVQGQLIRVEAATQRDYSTMIDVEIDGQMVSVPKAFPQTDSQGNIVRDAEGRTIPRRTTIYDAAYQLFGEDLKTKQIIPTLCHLEHMHPVGVCRVCSVEVCKREKDPKDPTKTIERAGEKLLPACVQPIEANNMVVHTRMSPTNTRARERVSTSVKVLLELLGADHLPDTRTVGGQVPSEQVQPPPTGHLPDTKTVGGQVSSEQVKPPKIPSEFEELVSVFSQEDCGVRPLDKNRFRFAGDSSQQASAPTATQPKNDARTKDETSHFILVDHSACILCNRCSRGCNDIKQNFVIGRTGKGYKTSIGFDLNDPMGISSCVECGECMLSCPTNALTFRSPIKSQWYQDELKKPGRSAVELVDLAADPLLGTMPRRWLQWNATSIVRWDVKAGETVCHIGEYGTTAFIIKSGQFDVLVPTRDRAAAPQKTWLSRLWGNGPPSEKQLRKVDILTVADHIFGEMSCLSSYPRNATVRASEPSVIYMIRRNALHTLQRNPRSREVLDDCYLKRAVFDFTRAIFDKERGIDFFQRLSPEERARFEALLRAEAKLVTLDPGQPVFRQGEEPDAFYLVRIGHVKITETYAGSERVLTYLGPNKLFGELAFVLQLPEFTNDASVPEHMRGRRNASASALDDVELVQVSPEVFRRILAEFPALREGFVNKARGVLKINEQDRYVVRDPQQQAFLDQGLFNAQRMLVIDLESCTRCDECTRACSDSHGGVARLIREGERLDNFLIASSCRSCTDPYCLVGCPVDSIHRNGERLEVRIDDHCIGCGLCANNCPYGSINMVVTEREKPSGPLAAVTSATAVLRHQARTCDLCTEVVGPNATVSCVYACPHEAAFRMSGEELKSAISARQKVR